MKCSKLYIIQIIYCNIIIIMVLNIINDTRLVYMAGYTADIQGNINFNGSKQSIYQYLKQRYNILND